jgi:hypothetical protein
MPRRKTSAHLSLGLSTLKRAESMLASIADGEAIPFNRTGSVEEHSNYIFVRGLKRSRRDLYDSLVAAAPYLTINGSCDERAENLLERISRGETIPFRRNGSKEEHSNYKFMDNLKKRPALYNRIVSVAPYLATKKNSADERLVEILDQIARGAPVPFRYNGTKEEHSNYTFVRNIKYNRPSLYLSLIAAAPRLEIGHD